jgi:hypothetical protein
MKIFLLFLVISFILGAKLSQATVHQRQWVIGSIVLVITATYYFFDQL